MKKGESLKKLLISIFKRKGGEGKNTFLFDNISSNNQELISSTLKDIEENEYGVLVYLVDENNHFIITTKRIIEKNNGIIISLNHSELKLADISLLKQYKIGAKSKKGFEIITLKFTNNEHDLMVEPDNPYWGLLNVLRYLAFNYPKSSPSSSNSFDGDLED